MRPQRVLVLGGGLSGLTTALELTDTAEGRRRFEVEVVQMGWRLGGKAASGVNSDCHHRVEEHGLHVWFGFYQNAFNLMQRCYDELDRPDSAPLHRLEDAFTPITSSTFTESTPGAGWSLWPHAFAHRGGLPGGSGPQSAPDAPVKQPPPLELTRRVLDWCRYTFAHHPRLRRLAPSLPPPPETWRDGGPAPARPSALFDRLCDGLWREGARFADLRANRWVVRALDRVRQAAVGALRADAERRLRTLIELNLTVVRGVIADGLVARGYAAADGEDFIDWLSRHGCSADGAAAPLVRTLYDIFFAYAGGDTRRPSLAAGAAVRVLSRMVFGWHGAWVWKMNAGMGDAIIAPIYEVLRRRGVRFRFFHRVDGLGLGPGGRRVETVRLSRQADLRHDGYEPLVDVGGLPCWPSEPRWAQLQGGDALRSAGAQLEDPRRVLPGGASVLRRGEHFDRVVLAISAGGLAPLTGELARTDERWRRMLDGLATVRTQAAQLWFSDPREALAPDWPSGMFAAFVQPFSSWSDFSQVLERERWTGEVPRYLAYSCGVLEDGAPTDVRGNMERWLDAHGRTIWPRAGGGDGAFDYRRLFDPEGRSGAARLGAQYIRHNSLGWERYVQATPGTGALRLRPDGLDVDNLTLTGAWTDTTLQLSCVEAAVMSGRMAARAIDGRTRHIAGEHDR